MPRTRPWEVTDAFWEHVQPLIPPAPSHAKGGRPGLSDRRAFEAIVYVLRTGMQWNALPRELGASSTVHDRFHPRYAQRDDSKQAKKSLTIFRESRRAEKWCGNARYIHVCEYGRRIKQDGTRKKEANGVPESLCSSDHIQAK